MPIIELYKGFKIWFNSIVNIYLALDDENNICFVSSTIEDLKKQIDETIH